MAQFRGHCFAAVSVPLCIHVHIRFFVLELHNQQKIPVTCAVIYAFQTGRETRTKQLFRQCSNNIQYCTKCGNRRGKTTHEMRHLFLIHRTRPPRVRQPCVMANKWEDWGSWHAPRNDETGGGHADGHWWSDGW